MRRFHRTQFDDHLLLADGRRLGHATERFAGRVLDWPPAVGGDAAVLGSDTAHGRRCDASPAAAVRGAAVRAVRLHEAGGDESRDRYFEQFERVTRDMPAYIRLARFSYVHEFAYDALAVRDQRVAMWLSTVGGSFEGWSIDDSIDMLTGAITAPVHSR